MVVVHIGVVVSFIDRNNGIEKLGAPTLAASIDLAGTDHIRLSGKDKYFHWRALSHRSLTLDGSATKAKGDQSVKTGPFCGGLNMTHFLRFPDHEGWSMGDDVESKLVELLVGKQFNHGLSHGKSHVHVGFRIPTVVGVG